MSSKRSRSLSRPISRRMTAGCDWPRLNGSLVGGEEIVPASLELGDLGLEQRSAPPVGAPFGDRGRQGMDLLEFGVSRFRGRILAASDPVDQIGGLPESPQSPLLPFRRTHLAHEIRGIDGVGRLHRQLEEREQHPEVAGFKRRLLAPVSSRRGSIAEANLGRRETIEERRPVGRRGSARGPPPASRPRPWPRRRPSRPQ